MVTRSVWTNEWTNTVDGRSGNNAFTDCHVAIDEGIKKQKNMLKRGMKENTHKHSRKIMSTTVVVSAVNIIGQRTTSIQCFDLSQSLDQYLRWLVDWSLTALSTHCRSHCAFKVRLY